ncbi:M16 family metallopeptidase [Chitinophagaceae bacterium LWZ2-11]
MKKFFLPVLLLSASVAVTAQQKYEWKQATGGGYTYQYVTGDPVKARFYTLPNGLTVVLSVNKKSPRIQTLIGTRAGSNSDPASHTGLAHYLEHMLFKGTDKYGSLDWSKEKPLLDQIDALYEQYNKIPTTDADARKAKYHEIDSVSGVAAKYAIANEYDKMMGAMGSQNTNAHTSVEETVYQEDIPSNAIDKYLAIQAERFRSPVLRLFHTELEAVYEEKNRGLDNDGWKVEEAMLDGLFPTHNYGQQTTIGTVEHLKNPSLIEIKNFYNKYYVPNNMALVMAGDFDPDVVIKKIDEDFKWWKSKPLTPYTPAPEKDLTAPVVKEVTGPTPDNLTIAWRTPGVNDYRTFVLTDLVRSILYNGKAGLLDLNLNKQQKALRSSAGGDDFKDYATLEMAGTPKTGQTLDDIKQLLLDQIALLKQGNFDEQLIAATVANKKKSILESLKNNNAIANYIMDDFIKDAGKLWDKNVASLDLMKTFTKKDIVDYANKYLTEGYVIVYKRKGEDKSITKVPKPAITPVSINKTDQSDFLKKIAAMPETPIKPVFLDYSKDVQKGNAGIATVYYSQNKDNDLFHLYYRFNMGTWNNKYLSLAAQYLQFLGTDQQSSAAISKQFYDLASSFSVSPGTEFTNVVITGLQENFTKTLAAFENLIHNCKADDEALQKLVARLQKQRSDSKLNKGAIMSGLTSYAFYGKQNPFNNTLTNDELKNLKASDLLDILHNLFNYKHDIIYYGPKTLPVISADLAAAHKLPASFTENPSKTNFTMQAQTSNQILFADYDMVQAEVYWIKTTDKYDPSVIPTIDLYNNYFGAGGMSGIVFQTLRESKALAYSTFAVYGKPAKLEDPFTFRAYIGAQADKIHEAVKSMNELINDLPENEKLLNDSKMAIKKDIATDRVEDESVIFSYLAAQRLGLNYDIRKSIYDNVDKLTFSDIKKFSQKEVSNKPYTYCIVASVKRVNPDELKQYGEVKQVTLEEIFGY